MADAAALLAERAAGVRPVLDVPLPTRLTASQLTVLARDPDGLAADLRRPLPRPVRPATRRGTSFHSWVEARFARQGALIELDELTGAADDCGSEEPAGLAQLQEAFLASEWADRVPLAVEVPFEVRVGSVLLAGRADAVFQDADGRFDVVDWKTGRPPGPAERAAQAVQLAVYRLAWARRRQVPLDAVRAAFFYTTTGQTVRPVDVLDEAGIIALIERLPTPQQGAGTSGT
jgi:DNA helicase-2/ATP-dependent DNA helicase PcrA